MAFNVNFNPSSTISGWNNTATKFFHPSVANPGNIKVLGNGLKGGVTEGTRKAGYYLNNATYKLANKTGMNLSKVMHSGSKLGDALSKVRGLDKVANGLSKLGKAGGKKIPGLGTFLAIGTGIYGIVKAGKLFLKNDKPGAAHRICKTAGTIGGIMAGAALMFTGVGFIPGLALAVGAGFAGDWLGKTAGNILCGKVDPKTGHSLQYLKANSQNQQAQVTTSYQNQLFGQSVALGSNAEFDAYISNILGSNTF